MDEASGGWGFKWIRLQVGLAPLDKLSVVVPPVTANAAQTEILTLADFVPTRPTPPLPSLLHTCRHK